MKRWVNFIFGLFFSLILLTNTGESFAQTITGETITGDATQSVGLNITVVAYYPNLTIYSPKNNTYLRNESILLNYSAINHQAVWYNIDNSSNITITSSLVYFSASEGFHNLYLYANSSYGNITARNVSFFVNSTKFNVIYSEFNASSQTTPFLNYSYEELPNFSGVILNNPIYGKILFNEPINLTDDLNSSDNTLNLDDNINISSNRIEINSTALPNFNKRATLFLYLSFINPRVLKDGSLCSSSICTIESYSGGLLKFNVTEFSIYSTEETPSESAGSSTSSSGGGGGGKGSIISINTTKVFSVDKDEIGVTLKQGETKKDKIIIKNIDNKKLEISIETKLPNFIKISEENFILNAGESKEINLDFIAREDISLGLYLDKLIIKSDGREEEVLIAIEVESKKPLFDVKVDIPNRYKEVRAGEELISSILLYNLGEIKRADVNIRYLIKDVNNVIIIDETETLAIETQASFLKHFTIPSYLREDDYIFYVSVTYNEEIASSSAWFSVIEGRPSFFSIKENYISWFLDIIIVLLLIISIIVIFHITRRNKKDSNRGKISKDLTELTKPIYPEKSKQVFTIRKV